MTDLYSQRELINEIAPFLDRFTWKTHNLGNCRCPICGDSKRKNSKKRFYFYENTEPGYTPGYWVKCHNCGYSTSLLNFVKTHYPDIHRKTVMEAYRNKEVVIAPVEEKPIEAKPLKIRDIPWIPVSDKPKASKYLAKRGLLQEDIKDLYYTDDFSELVEHFGDDEPENYGFDERIVFPLRDKNGNLIGFQGRLMDKSSKGLRYITYLRKDIPKHPKMFGLDKIDVKQRVYITEGPIDSLFLPNAIASCGSDLISCIRKLEEIGCTDFVFIFDNEPRNTQICDKMEYVIEEGHSICILPASMTEKGKDLNDYILAGMSREIILDTINTHTYKGLRARIEYGRRMGI